MYSRDEESSLQHHGGERRDDLIYVNRGGAKRALPVLIWLVVAVQEAPHPFDGDCREKWFTDDLAEWSGA